MLGEMLFNIQLENVGGYSASLPKNATVKSVLGQMNHKLHQFAFYVPNNLL